MKNFNQPGNIVSLTAPVGGVVSGTAYLIGALFGVALHSADAGESFEMSIEGVFTLPKESTAAFTEGEIVFWDDTAKELDESAAGRFAVGVAVAAAVATTTTVAVKLNGVGVVAVT